MNREAIEKEVRRLQDRCYTDEGKAGIVTDYIMRLLAQQEAQLMVRTVCENCGGWLKGEECENCASPVSIKAPTDSNSVI